MSCHKVAVTIALGCILCYSPDARSQYHPCTAPSPPEFVNRQNNYPVVVYDALRRKSYLMFRQYLLSAAGHQAAGGVAAAALPDLSPAVPIPFLCSQYPVEVFVINRRLKTDFVVSLTAAIKAQTGHLAISG